MTGQVAQPIAEQNTGTGDTGNGFLVGTEPAQPRQQVDWDGATAPTGSPQAAPVQIVEGQPPAKFYTEEDINRVRQEEKSKLYGRIDEMSETLKTLQKEREEREEAEQKARQEADAARKAAEEEKLSAKELIEQRTKEMEERFSALEAQRAAEQAVFEKEREFNRLQDYQRDRVAQESEYIMPELRDFISGSSEAEIDASIERAKQKSAEIMGHVSQQAVQSRQELVGVSPTAPPVGPMEQQSTLQTLTPQDIATMDMETYKQHRGSLLAGARNQYYSGR